MDYGITKANKKINAELNKQLDIFYPMAATILWREYGWRRLRIIRFFEITWQVWSECADAGVEKSMIEMLEDETGIEIRMPNMKSYHELPYLDVTAWDKTYRKKPTKQELLYIRQQQAKWIPAMLLSCICLALHRKEGWGTERIAKFVGYAEAIRAEYGQDLKKYYELVESVTDFKRKEVTMLGRHR